MSDSEEDLCFEAGEPVPADADEEAEEKARDERRVPSALTAAKLQKAVDTAHKRGLVYLSRVAPFMKPQKLRFLLSKYGEVLRIYLAAEDASSRSKRKKAGGNSGKKFTEGWVEFADKKVAKRVAAMLNGQQIGGPKRSAFYYDLWNIKYLPKFKWEHLTEEIAYQKAIREQKLALELSASKRERDFYLKQVDQAKAISAMSDKQQRRAAAASSSGGPGGRATAADVAASVAARPQPKAGGKQAAGQRLVRQFVQREARVVGDQPRVSASTLAAVFGANRAEAEPRARTKKQRTGY